MAFEKFESVNAEFYLSRNRRQMCSESSEDFQGSQNAIEQFIADFN